MIGELLKRLKVDADFGRGRGETERVVGFQEDFESLVEGMMGAYLVDQGVYGQEAANKREEKNQTLNNGKYFLDNLVLNREIEQGAIREYASGHVAKSYGEGERVKMGRLTVPVETVERLTPDSSPSRTVEVVVTLAKKAAQLKALTKDEEGIPEAYALARVQTNKALELVMDAATLAYGWKSDSWGRLSLEGVLERASKRMFGKQARTAVLIGALALAGCEEPIVPVGGVTPSLEPTATRTEQVMTRAPIENAEIDSAIATLLTSLTTPTPEQSFELSELQKVREGFEQQANALPGWEEVKPESMEFAVVNIYNNVGSIAGGFLLAKNLETSEQMVLSVVEKFEADGTAVRKQVNSPLYERFSIDAEGRLINGDWYYVDQEGNHHSLYKTNAEGKLGGVPIEGEIIWSDMTFRIETISDLSLAKLAKIALPPGDLTGLNIDTELGQITDSEGNVIYTNKDGEWGEPQVDLTSLVEPGQEIREVNGYQAVGYEKTWEYPPYQGEYEYFVKKEFRLMVVQGSEGAYKVNGGQVEQYQNGKWEVMEWPEGARLVEFFDIKDIDGNGTPEIYGIDEYGLAVSKLVDGKWEKYTREIRGLNNEDVRSGISEMYLRIQNEAVVIAEPNIEDVVRLTGSDGEPLYWDGWKRLCDFDKNHQLKECKIGEGGPMVPGTSGVVYMPAILRGVYPGYDKYTTAVVYELPRRYERQVVIDYLGPTNEFSSGMIPTGKNVNWVESLLSGNDARHVAWFKAYLGAVAAGEAPMYQVMAQLKIIDYKISDEFQREINELSFERMEGLMADEATIDRITGWRMDQIYVPEEMGKFVW